GDQGGDRGDVDDAAGAPNQHRAGDQLGQREGRDDVDLEGVPECFHRVLLRPAAGGDPGVVDQDVDLITGGVRDARPVLVAGDIGDHGPATDLLGDLAQPLLAARRDYDVRAGLGQDPREALADAGGGPGA